MRVVINLMEIFTKYFNSFCKSLLVEHIMYARSIGVIKVRLFQASSAKVFQFR